MNATRAASRSDRRRPLPDPGAAAAVEIHFTLRDSLLGRVLVAVTAHGLCAVMLGEDDADLELELRRHFPSANVREGGDDVTAIAGAVVAHIEVPERSLGLPLDLAGTEFQRSVWEALRLIPAGTTESYRDVARRIGRPASIRAVGAACAANPLAIIVPCHRVVRSDGGLAGYRWGVERKRRLLEREGAR